MQFPANSKWQQAMLGTVGCPAAQCQLHRDGNFLNDSLTNVFDDPNYVRHSIADTECDSIALTNAVYDNISFADTIYIRHNFAESVCDNIALTNAIYVPIADNITYKFLFSVADSDAICLADNYVVAYSNHHLFADADFKSNPIAN